MNILRGPLLAAAAVIAASTLLVGCTLSMRAYPTPHEPPPPPSHRHAPLTRGEIAEIASAIALDRGYTEFRIEELEREDDQRWEVEIEGWVGPHRAELEMVLDGWDGAILEIEDSRKKHKHKHKRKYDDDDD